MPAHDAISSRVTAQTPFAAMRTTYSSPERQRGHLSARTYSWIGRITHSWRETDKNARIAFLYDVEPLIGGPSAPADPTLAKTAGASNSVIQYVRLAQPYCGNIQSTDTTVTGIIIAPEVGSLVLVSEDPYGWIITGFLSGPSFPLGNVPALGETTQNPGIEEVSNTLYASTFIADLYNVTEGDVILGRGKARVRLASQGLFVGVGPNSCEFIRTDGVERYSRFVNLELRAPAYLGYRRTFFGTSITPLFTRDQCTVHTDINDINPDITNLTPYVVRQIGHVTAAHLDAGRFAGEIVPSPLTTAVEQTTRAMTVIRETVVQPVTQPTGSAADSHELVSTSGVVYDFQVRADGSFHIRSGKAQATTGASHYGQPTDNTLDLQFDSKTSTLKLRLGVSGAPLINVVAEGTKGVLTVVAADSLVLQTPKIVFPLATSFVANGAIEFTAPSISFKTPKFAVKTAAIDIDGGLSGSWQKAMIKAGGDVIAGAISPAGGVSLLTHTHTTTTSGNPTSPPIPTP